MLVETTGPIFSGIVLYDGIKTIPQGQNRRLEEFEPKHFMNLDITWPGGKSPIETLIEIREKEDQILLHKDTLENDLHQVKQKEFEIADALNEVRFALGIDDGITESNQFESLVKNVSPPSSKSGPSSKINNERIIAVEQNQKSMEGKIDTIEGKIVAMEANLESNQKSMEGKINTIEGKIVAMEANLKDIKDIIVKMVG